MLKLLPLTLIGLGVLLFGACGGKTTPEGDTHSANVDASPTRGETPLYDHPVSAGVDLTWDAPDTWTVQTPASSMRSAQYELPGLHGAASMVVYYFGPGQGGLPRANAERWARQFQVPGEADPVQSMVVEEFLVNGFPVLLVTIRGTFTGGMTSAGPQDLNESDYKLVGAIVTGPDANWFFKLIGPERTVDTHLDVFRDLIQTIRAPPRAPQ